VGGLSSDLPGAKHRPTKLRTSFSFINLIFTMKNKAKSVNLNSLSSQNDLT